MFGINDEVLALRRVNPVNTATSVPYWHNTTVEVTAVCPTHVRLVNPQRPIHVYGYRFHNLPTLTCQFVNTQSDGTATTYRVAAHYLTPNSVSCAQPAFTADGRATVQVSLYGVVFAPSSVALTVALGRPEAGQGELDACHSTALTGVADPTDNELHRYFELRGFSLAQLMVDWGHIPSGPTYGTDYKLAVYATQSICINRVCNAQNQPIEDLEASLTSPCRQPIPFSGWFSSPIVSKASLFNLTIFALEDVVFHIEVQILNGLYSALLPMFANTITVEVFSPKRANVSFGVSSPPMRALGPAVSYEGAPVAAEFMFLAPLEQAITTVISPPLNLPPRFGQFKAGRVLAGFNVSRAAAGIPLGDTDGHSDSSTDPSGAPVTTWITTKGIDFPASYWQVRG